MKTLLQIEEAVTLVLSTYLYYAQLHFSGWLFWALFLLPDLGMAGYLINPKLGAITYNLLHHKGVAILLYIIGFGASSELLQLAGLVILGHSSFDRVLGYGLKYSDSFSHTHLGMIGKNPTQER